MRQKSGAWALAGHDVVELLLGDLSVLVLIGFLDHFLELVLVDVFAEFLDDGLEVLDGDESGLVEVEEVEYLLQVLAGVLVRNALSHQVQELVEVDLAPTFLHQVRYYLEDWLIGRL